MSAVSAVQLAAVEFVPFVVRKASAERSAHSGSSIVLQKLKVSVVFPSIERL